MDIFLLAIISYFQIAHSLALTHKQLDSIDQPFYVRQKNGYFINLALWPLGSRPNRFIWFILVLLLIYLSNLSIYLLLGFLIENSILRILFSFIFSFTPVGFFLISTVFALIRFIFSFFKFRSYFLKAIFQKLTKRRQVDDFILEKNPRIRGNALQANLMDIYPGAPKRKKVLVWVAHIYFFVDSITWLAAFFQTLCGDSRDLHESKSINEKTAINYASDISSLSRE